MKIFAIGDLHLSQDPRVQKPMDVFGPDWVNHEERVRQHWEETVGPEDLVLLPGDISWGLRQEEALADFDWIHRLPGTKVITKGNHDLWWGSIQKLNRLYDDVIFLQNHCYVAGEVAVCGTRGWICPGADGFDQHDEKIYQRELLRLRFSLEEGAASGASVLLAALHYPPTNDKIQDSDFTRLLSAFGVKTCVYGHLHGRDAYRNGIRGVLGGVEYRLVSLDYLEGKPALIYQTRRKAPTVR